MRKILVSECLYGGRPVRYDGAEAVCADPVFLRWKSEGRLVPVCPEILGGLSVPRPASQRVDGGVVTEDGGDVTAAFIEGAECALRRAGGRVVTEDGGDVTAAFIAGAECALRRAAEQDVAFAILKDGSPSCGVNLIYDGTFTGRKIPGRGVAAERLAAAGYRVFSEEDIAAAAELLGAIEK
jgi:uncharacterized protein YbbK (DUF523 family)